MLFLTPSSQYSSLVNDFFYLKKHVIWWTSWDNANFPINYIVRLCSDSDGLVLLSMLDGLFSTVIGVIIIYLDFTNVDFEVKAIILGYGE